MVHSTSRRSAPNFHAPSSQTWKLMKRENLGNLLIITAGLDDEIAAISKPSANEMIWMSALTNELCFFFMRWLSQRLEKLSGNVFLINRKKKKKSFFFRRSCGPPSPNRNTSFLWCSSCSTFQSQVRLINSWMERVGSLFAFRFVVFLVNTTLFGWDLTMDMMSRTRETVIVNFSARNSSDLSTHFAIQR